MSETQVKINAKVIDSKAHDQIKLMQQSPAFHGLISIMPDVHPGMGSVIGFTGKFKDVVIPATIGVDIGCVDKDTQYLTKNGWINISNYNGEEILVYDKKNNKSFFEKPKLYIVKPEDEFNYIKTKYGVTMCVSDEHNLLSFRGKHHKTNIGASFDINAKDMFDKHEKLKLGFRDKFLSSYPNMQLNEESDLDANIIRVIVMIMADGYIANYNTLRCICAFKKERKIKRCELLLNLSNIRYDKVIKNGITKFMFTSPKPWKRLSKFYNCSKVQLAIILKEIKYWDSDFKNNVFCSKYKEDVDFVQYAYNCLGKRATINRDNRLGKETYRVIPSENIYISISGTPKTKSKKIKSLDGLKYCFITSTGYWASRKEDDVIITGNCGVTAFPLGKIDITKINFEKLDKHIRAVVPLGFKSQKDERYLNKLEPIYKMAAKDLCNNIERNFLKQKYKEYTNPVLQLGTLGGGNHFIELGKADDGEVFVIVHSGSRNLGQKVAMWYQGEAIKFCKAGKITTAKHLEYLPLEYGGEEYIKYMTLTQQYARLNREIMIQNILKFFNITYNRIEVVESTHNYLSEKDGIVRKGAISAHKHEEVIIPLNMSDGTILGIGKGNTSYNNSAPHGAGRVHGRNVMKQQLRDGVVTMNQFKDKMDGIFTTCIHNGTIDESPMAYKTFDDIKEYLEETVTITKVLKPIYNLKG